MSSPIVGVESKTHPVSVKLGEKSTKAMASFIADTMEPGKDFELAIRIEPSNKYKILVMFFYLCAVWVIAYKS